MLHKYVAVNSRLLVFTVDLWLAMTTKFHPINYNAKIVIHFPSNYFNS